MAIVDKVLRVVRATAPWALAAVGAVAPALAQSVPVPVEPSGSTLLVPPSNLQLPGVDPRQCGTSKHAALCAEGRWARFARAQVDVRVGTFRGAYTFEQTASGEVHGTTVERMAGKTQAGEAVVVSEDAFAFRARSVAAQPDDNLDPIMTPPALFSALVAILLEAALPENPADITRTQHINATSSTQFIRTQAPGATILYGPPWAVTGTVRRIDGDTLAFDLDFRFSPVDEAGRVAKSRTDTARLTGSLHHSPMRERLPDSLDLVGWKLVRAGALLGDVKTLAEARNMVGAR